MSIRGRKSWKEFKREKIVAHEGICNHQLPAELPSSGDGLPLSSSGSDGGGIMLFLLLFFSSSFDFVMTPLGIEGPTLPLLGFAAKVGLRPALALLGAIVE